MLLTGQANYGIGHAVYSVSDPRAKVFKSFVENFPRKKTEWKSLNFYSMVERLAPEIIREKGAFTKVLVPMLIFTAASFMKC